MTLDALRPALPGLRPGSARMPGHRRRARGGEPGRRRTVPDAAAGAAGPGRPTSAPTGPPRRPQPGTGQGGRPLRRTAPHRGRRRIGQDPGPDPSHRLAHRGAGRLALRDPGHHLHEQGGSGDAGTGRGAGRSGGPAHVGVDLPRRLRPHPAAGRVPPRLQGQLHHLRPGRRRPAHRVRDPGPQPRLQAFPAPVDPRADLGRQERAARLRELLSPVPHRHGAPGGRGVPRVSTAPARRQRHGLRRPPAGGGQRVASLPRRARALPGAVPPRPRGRVPGHQPGPKRTGPPARRRPPAGLGRRRQRPVGLRMARGRYPQHPAVRGGLPGRHRRGAGTELPLHPDDPRRRQRRHRQQRQPPPEGPVDRAGSAGVGRPLSRRGRTRRGAMAGGRGAPSARRADGAGPRSGARYDWGDIAVFYRTNAQSRAIEEELVRQDIPYQVVGGTRFYDRAEIKDLLAYLRAVANPVDEVSLKRIVNVPKRGVGDTSVARMDRYARQLGAPLRRRHGQPRGRRRQRQGGRRASPICTACSPTCARRREEGRRSGPAAGSDPGADRVPGRPGGRSTPSRPPGASRTSRSSSGRPGRPTTSTSSWSRSAWSPTPTRSTGTRPG